MINTAVSAYTLFYHYPYGTWHLTRFSQRNHDSEKLSENLYSRVPRESVWKPRRWPSWCWYKAEVPSPRGHGLILVRGLLGTGPHWRRWTTCATSKRAKRHLYIQLLPISGITAWAPPPVESGAALDSLRTVNVRDLGCCSGWESNADDQRRSWG